MEMRMIYLQRWTLTTITMYNTGYVEVKTCTFSFHATPNPWALSRAFSSFSANASLDEYSGRSKRPKQVKLVGIRWKHSQYEVG